MPNLRTSAVVIATVLVTVLTILDHAIEWNRLVWPLLPGYIAQVLVVGAHGAAGSDVYLAIAINFAVNVAAYALILIGAGRVLGLTSAGAERAKRNGNNATP